MIPVVKTPAIAGVFISHGFYMKTWLIVCACTSVFYLMTGLVRYEGGFDQALVIKPRPILAITFGGGEEGQWRRTHPSDPMPWFMTGDYIQLIDLDWEERQPLLADVYFYGWFVNALLTFGVVLAMLMTQARLWCARRKRTPAP